MVASLVRSDASPRDLRSWAVLRFWRSLGDRPPLALALIVLASAGLVSAFSLRVTSYEPDELGYTHLAIGIAHSLTPFTRAYGGAQRLNQLYPLLIAPLWGAFGNVSAFRLTHVWNALLMTSSAVPAYLLTRQVLRERWAAYGAAALVAVMPWVVIATAELTEVAAFPACAWALLAMQRCLVRPSVRSDVVAVAAIALASYGRLQLIVLAPVLVVAVIVHELGYELRVRRPAGAAFRVALGRIVRNHSVLSVITVIALVVGIPALLSGELAKAFGFYGDTLSTFAFGAPTFDLARTFMTGVVLGLGAIPVAMAAGFFLSSLVAPLDRRTHAFAALSLIAIVAIVLQVAEISANLTGGVMQERYVFYIVPLLVVGMFACVLGNRHPARALIVGSVITALVVASTTYDTSRTPFWFQISPGLTSFYGWIAPAFGASGSPTVDADTSALLPAGLVIMALGVAIALAIWRGFGGRLLKVLTVLAIAFCCALTVHALHTVVKGNASGGGIGGGNLHDVSWVDAHVHGTGTVAQLIDNQGGQAASAQLYNNNVFWNRAVGSSYAQTGFDWPVYLPIGHLGVDRSTGRLTLGGGGSEPRDMVVATHGALVTPVGSIQAKSPNGTFELIRLAHPLRARDAVSGVSSDGWLAADHPGRLRVWSATGAKACARAALTFSLSSLAASDETLQVGGSRGRVVLRPGRPVTVDRRVCPDAARPAVLTFRYFQPADGADTLLAPQLLDARVTP